MARDLFVLALLGVASLRGTTGQLNETCAEGEQVQCPGTGVMCAGNNCCPGTAASGEQTFPCPSASPGWMDCDSAVKVTDCLANLTDNLTDMPTSAPSAAPSDAPTGAPTASPTAVSGFTVVAQNMGCSNFASLQEIARFPGGVSNVICAQRCAEMNCTFWTYQDEPNVVCEALQPTPKPLQPALGDDSCILFAGRCKKEENACWDVLTLSAPPAPAPPLFTLLSENTGCSNFASLTELARFPGEVSNAFCAQACYVTKDCTFWTYQDEPNVVCEALQPTPKPLQPALGDDSCILFAGRCKKEENACWDVLTLSAAQALRLYDDAPESKSAWELDKTSVAVPVSLGLASALLAVGAVIRVAGSRASSLPASTQDDERESLRASETASSA